MKPLLRTALLFTILAAGLGASGCVVAPAQRTVVDGPPPVPPVNIIAYPARGQSPEQLASDRAACNTWSIQQTGFDPQAPGAPRTVVQPGSPPGTGTAIGAIAGAVIGAALSNRWDRGAGVLFGGLTGAAIGSNADAGAAMQANAEQAQLDRHYAQNAAQAAAAADNYRRAMGACLDARGYTVR